MAKSILSFFGGLAIIAGFLFMLLGFGAGKETWIITLPVGAGLLVSGAPLLGFARVIELLESINANTKASIISSPFSAPGHVESETEIRKHIQKYKSAMSMNPVYVTNVGGETRKFNSDAEAVAYVSSVLRTKAAGAA